MIDYIWNVSNCEVYPNKNGLQNVVHKVHYIVKGIDTINLDENNNNYYATMQGRVYLDTTDLSNFIAWQDLTSQIVQNWVEANLGADNVATIKSDIEAKINNKINPSSVNKILGS
ncbi:MAG: hypothetical protein GOVbin1578_30 [Prokaryotic dsDNA virus sp.]|nr:MAG: hypothetical protein GOVbin1578_30 [Prokaryotic dsDNA virus sp.]|tara:strand:+ start:8017 stop:8361 length:345 start_codon:yes stop_codon:yes gene_type:complete